MSINTDQKTEYKTKKYVGSGFMTIAKYNNSGNRIYIGDKESKVITSIDTTTYMINGSFEGHKGVIWSLDVTKDDTKLISCSGDMSIIIWNTKNGEILKQIMYKNIPKYISIQKTSRNLAVVYCEAFSKKFATNIIIYDLDKLSEEELVPEYTIEWTEKYKPTVVRWLPENNENTFSTKLIIGCDNGLIIIRDILDDTVNKSYKIHDDSIKSIIFNKTNTNILTSSLDTTAKQVNLDNWEVVKTFKSTVPINHAIYSHNDKRVILAGSIETMLIAKTSNNDLNIKIYRTSDQKLVNHISSHFGPIRYIDKAPNNKNFVTASQDGSVKIYVDDDLDNTNNTDNTDNNSNNSNNINKKDYKLFGSFYRKDELKLLDEINKVDYVNIKPKIKQVEEKKNYVVGMVEYKNQQSSEFKINDNITKSDNLYSVPVINSTIKISNIPYDTDYHSLIDVFDFYGRIEENGVRIKHYRDDTIAFIKYCSVESAQKAIDSANKKPFNHCIITVELANPI